MFSGEVIRVIWIIVGWARTYAAIVVIGIHVVLSSSCVLVPEALARAALVWPTGRVVGHVRGLCGSCFWPTLGFADPKTLNSLEVLRNGDVFDLCFDSHSRKNWEQSKDVYSARNWNKYTHEPKHKQHFLSPFL